MFKPKYVKHGELLVKGVQKFLRYKTDVMKEGKQEEVEAKLAEFKEALANRDEEKCKALTEELTKTCEKSVPVYQSSALRENIEVLFVTIVFALGIRAYFLQPFKIPTGSMEPTLFGIQADPSWGEEDYEPNMLVQGWELLKDGRNYLEVESPVTGRLVGYRPDEWRLATLTMLEYETESGERVTQRVWAPPRQLYQLWKDGGWAGRFGGNRNEPPVPNQKVTKGEMLAKGSIATGDQVLVNKISYHFRRPARGEVFVFNTRGIKPLMVDHAGRPKLSTHYIKRLCGLPGDEFEVVPPYLKIDGELAKEPGISRVWEEKTDNYPGYTNDGNFLEGTLEEEQYLALGDNSGNSYDSRGWRTVPERDIVGPALVVYWPFSSRWGRIR